MITTKKITFIALCLLAANITSFAQIQAVGPATGPLGYPLWIRDSTGLTFELCTDTTGLCIPPADGEAFYWSAEAEAPLLAGQGKCLLVLAWEAAYGGDEAQVNGNQIIFARLRIRVDVAVPGTYTVTHPYGQMTFENVTVEDGINYTEDMGGMHPALVEQAFGGIRATQVDTALVWPDYQTNPLLTNPANGDPLYVGDAATPHIVTGSPTGNNLFRVEGPGGISTETDEFTVMGKLYQGQPATPWTYPAPVKSLDSMGPVNRVTTFDPTSTAAVTGGPTEGYPLGYPVWYKDKRVNGLQLTICPGEDPMCISEPADINDPNSVLIGMGEEGFFWTCEARIDIDADNQALLVMAVESAFGGDGNPKDGLQMVFGRIRIRIDAPRNGTYTVTHPFGTNTFRGIVAGKDAVNYTEDIGGGDPIDPDAAMNGVLYGRISKFLTWTDYLNDPSLNIDGVQYIGNPLVDHTITGSPTGNNFFRVSGAVNVRTDLFSVSGKVIPTIPTAVKDNAVVDQDSSIVIDVLANDINAVGDVNVRIPANLNPANGTAVVNPDNTVTYTPNPGFFGTDGFSYQVAVAASAFLVSNTVTVSIFVNSVGPFAISGNVIDLAGLPLEGVSMALTGPAIKTVATDATGNYTFAGRADGNYMIIPTLAGAAFSPTYRKPIISGADVTAQDFNQTADIVAVTKVTVSALGRATAINGPLWGVAGTGTPGATVSIFLGQDFEGELIGTATVSRLGKWTFRKRAPVVTPLTEATGVSVSSSAGGGIINQPLITVARASVSTRGVIATTRGPLWSLSGRGAPGTTLDISLGPDLTGEQIGTVTVKPNGVWSLRGRIPVALPITETSISISSSSGETALNRPLTVR